MKKIGILVLALVLALGTLGAAYALWSDSLYIEGTVRTGDIGLVWTQGDPFDSEIPEKDVSWGECVIIDNVLYIDVYNAYPCIEYVFPIDLHGVGSVPVHTAMTVTSFTGQESWVILPNLSDMQIHQGDDWFGEIIIHLDNSAEELSQYSFTVQLDYWQYNEDDVALPLVPFTP